MSTEVFELAESRSYNANRGERRYVVYGTNSESAARAAVVAEAPSTWNGLIRGDTQIDVEASFDSQSGHDVFDAVVPYSRTQPPSVVVGKVTEAWSTTGGMQHVTQSGASVGYGPDADASANKNAINLDPETGEVRGVDIVVPQRSLTLRVQLDPTDVTDVYQEQLTALTGRVNNASFRGHAAGEVLFLGADAPGYTDGDPLYELVYNFAISPNRSGLEIGDITVTSKLGWHYLDVRYKAVESGSQVFQQPRAAYVHGLYLLGDFSVLKYGT